MLGDLFVVEEYHRRAVKQIVRWLMPRIETCEERYTVTVAGELGSGKAATARAMVDALKIVGLSAKICSQNDYFVLPPKLNNTKRRKDISWVGPQEVRLDLLDEHLHAAKGGESSITKPQIRIAEDRVSEEVLSLSGIKVVIAEGTYAMLLKNADVRIFIDQNRVDTLEVRRKRERGPIEPFIEQVLEIEHAIVSGHKEKADIVVTKDYGVIMPE